MPAVDPHTCGGILTESHSPSTDKPAVRDAPPDNRGAELIDKLELSVPRHAPLAPRLESLVECLHANGGYRSSRMQDIYDLERGGYPVVSRSMHYGAGSHTLVMKPSASMKPDVCRAS